jgi:uncharacterized protein
MKRIGLLSDTHGLFPERLYKFFAKVDEIWHAGDIGSTEVADIIRKFKTFRAVYGNIDGQDVRLQYQKHEKFDIEGVSVWMTHIGGYPGNYDRNVRSEILVHPPDLFISGHSHILKVQYDQKLNLLHINPGAAGNNGFHKVCTAVRFVLENGKPKDLEICEWQRI